MKFFFDQNLSKPLAKALNELTPPETKCIHLDERYRSTTDDVDWLRAIGGEGGWVVLTQDKGLRVNPAERDAIEEFGLMVVCLTSQWQRLPLWDQYWMFIRAFPEIQEICQEYRHGSWYELKPRFGKKQIEQKTMPPQQNLWVRESVLSAKNAVFEALRADLPLHQVGRNRHRV